MKNSKRRAGGKTSKGSTDVTKSAFVPPRNWLSHHIGGLPQSQRRTLSWFAFNPSTSVAFSTYAESTALLNSPYDPDPTLGGTSATGFAKYMQFYSKCFCIGARYKVKFQALNDQPIVVGTVITTNTSSLVTLPQAVQNGLSQYDTMQANTDHRTFQGGIDIAKFVDKPIILDDPQFFCTASANPSQIVVLHIFVHNMTFAATAFYAYTAEIEFDCVFTDPIPFT